LGEPQYTDTTVAVCNEYTWWRNGETYYGSGTQVYTYMDDMGCENADTLHLTIVLSVTTHTMDTVCDSIVWNGQTYRESGELTFSGTNVMGCDSVDILNLTVNHSTASTTMVPACDSFTWNLTGDTYTHDTILSALSLIPNTQGCDSVVTLYLTVAHGAHETYREVNCGAYEWHQEWYAESGTYTYDYIDTAGCPSTDTLYLTVGEPQYSDTTVVACNEYTWWRSGETYYGSNTYVHVYTDEAGCESVDTMHLTVVLSVTTHFVDTVCDSIVWLGRTYRQSGTYTSTATSAMGCDSINVLELTVNQSKGSTTVVSTCDSYNWYEHVGVTESTDTLTHRFPMSNGCDSVVHLRLTIYHSDSTTHITDTACGSYQWNGLNYASSGTYRYYAATSHHCDSILTLHLTVHPDYAAHHYDTICAGESYQFNGEECLTTGEYVTTFRTVHGCDSLQILHLFALPRPVANIMTEYSCEKEEYKLSASREGYRYTWSATPGGHQVTGQEHDDYVLLHPRDTMTVMLTVEYLTGRACPSVAQINIVPLHNVTASIECHPEALDRDNRTLTAVDASVGHTEHGWYVDGTYWGDDPYIVYTADEYAEELLLMLVAYNDYCADTAQRIVKVVDDMLFIPNVFTPSLSTNSTFRAYGKGILEFYMVIYNREGNKIFESHDMEEAWDGTHNGTACPQGSYVYRIRYRGERVPDGWIDATGSILLLR